MLVVLRNLGLLISLGLLGCGGPAAPGPEPERAVRAVETTRVRREAWPTTLRVSGELVAFDEATLATKVAGRLAALYVDLGSPLVAGECTGQMDSVDLELRLAQAEAAVEVARAELSSSRTNPDDAETVDPSRAAIVREARAELDSALADEERLVRLREEGVATAAALDEARTRARAAEGRLASALEEIETRRALLRQRLAELDIARAAVADARLIAPFDGAVSRRLASPGDYLDRGDPVLRVVRFDPIRLRLEVPERSAAAVRAGLALRVELAGGEEREAHLTHVSPDLDPQNRTLRVEAHLPNADGALRAGSFARAEIVLDPEADALVVPQSALVRFAGLHKLFVVDPPGPGGERRAREQAVRIGRADEARVEILDGVEEGALVVLEPRGLRNGDRIESGASPEPGR